MLHAFSVNSVYQIRVCLVIQYWHPSIAYRGTLSPSLLIRFNSTLTSVKKEHLILIRFGLSLYSLFFISLVCAGRVGRRLGPSKSSPLSLTAGKNRSRKVAISFNLQTGSWSGRAKINVCESASPATTKKKAVTGTLSLSVCCLLLHPEQIVGMGWALFKDFGSLIGEPDVTEDGRSYSPRTLGSPIKHSSCRLWCSYGSFCS